MVDSEMPHGSYNAIPTAVARLRHRMLSRIGIRYHPLRVLAQHALGKPSVSFRTPAPNSARTRIQVGMRPCTEKYSTAPGRPRAGTRAIRCVPRRPPCPSNPAPPGAVRHRPPRSPGQPGGASYRSPHTGAPRPVLAESGVRSAQPRVPPSRSSSRRARGCRRSRAIRPTRRR